LLLLGDADLQRHGVSDSRFRRAFRSLHVTSGCRGKSENPRLGATAVATRDARFSRFACHDEGCVSALSSIFICFFTVPSASGRALAEQIAAVFPGLPDIRYFFALNIILGHPASSPQQLSKRGDSCFDNCRTETTGVLIL
jgi:hypothetical protein